MLLSFVVAIIILYILYHLLHISLALPCIQGRV